MTRFPIWKAVTVAIVAPVLIAAAAKATRAESTPVPAMAAAERSGATTYVRTGTGARQAKEASLCKKGKKGKSNRKDKRDERRAKRRERKQD